MPIRKTEAIVLASRPWRDSSAVLTFYTRGFGRVCAVARGSKRSRSPFGSALEPLCRLSLVYHEKEGRSLETVSEASLEDSYQELRGDLERLGAGAYMAQLLDQMVRGREDCERIYGHLVCGMELLRSGVPAELAARYFELRFLGLCGYHPRLSSCVGCHHTVRGDMRFSSRLGGMLCGNCDDRDTRALPVSRGTYRALLHLEQVPPERLKRLRLPAVVRAELRRCLTGYVTYLLERRPRALDFLERMVDRPVGAGTTRQT